MRFINKVWDFIFGVTLIAGVPVIIIVLTLSLFGTFGQISVAWFPLSCAVFWVVLITALVVALRAVIRWRKGHRCLSPAFLWVEICVGLVLGMAYFFFLVAASAFAAMN